jgi:Ca2+-binding EF-hand superfamily protein
MTEARTLNTKVPYTSISEMMRALGYYPTEKEVQNM